MTDISQTAILVSVSISNYSGDTLDRAAGQALTAQHAAASDAARVIKSLLGKEIVGPIKTIAGAYRNNTVYHLTLPWLQDGSRILPTAVYDRFESETRAARDAWEKEKISILSRWPELKARAVKNLGSLGCSEFPEVEAARAKYSFEVRTLPVPSSADWRVNVSAAAMTRMRQENDQRVAALVAAGTRDTWERVRNAVANMVARCEAYEAVDPAAPEKRVPAIRNTLVENMRELAAILPALNLAGDPNMTAIAAELSAKLCKFSGEELRESVSARQETGKAAKKILSLVDAYTS